MNAVGGLHVGQVEGRGNIVGDGAAGQLGVYGEVAGEQVLGVQVAEQHVGIGDGGVLAAKLVAGRAWERAGTLWADAERAAAVHGGDAAAARANLCQVYGGDAEDVAAAAQQAMSDADAAADLVLRSLQHLAVLDDGRLGGGASHVESHQVGHTETATEVERAYHASSRAGLDAVDGTLHGDARGGEAAVGLHHGEGHGDSHVLKALGEKGQVALHDGTDVAVDYGGAGALVLLHFRQQV